MPQLGAIPSHASSAIGRVLCRHKEASAGGQTCWQRWSRFAKPAS